MLTRFAFYLGLLAVLVWVSGCQTPPPGRYAGSALASSTAYGRAPDKATARGIFVTDYASAFQRAGAPGPVGLSALDRAVNLTEECLAALPEPDEAESRGMGCLWQHLPRVIDRAAFEVLIPSDWYTSQCTGQELFPCNAPATGCDEKPQLAGLSCPCNCRATVQDNFLIVTVPNAGVMHTPEQQVFRGELLRLATACNVPWNGPLAKCTQSM